jgi:beta-lactamase regulating signal transducer with metallopeptidase domain
MSIAMGWLIDAAALALTTAAAAGPLALLVFVIDATIGRRMAAHYRFLLWTLVAVRLLMPVAPESALSVQNAWQLVALQNAPRDAMMPDLAPAAALLQANVATPPSVELGAPAASHAQPTCAPVIWNHIFFGGISTVWILGAACVFVRAVIASTMFAKRLRAIPCVEDQAHSPAATSMRPDRRSPLSACEIRTRSSGAGAIRRGPANAMFAGTVSFSAQRLRPPNDHAP